jgi:predicted DNA-binding protein
MTSRIEQAFLQSAVETCILISCHALLEYLSQGFNELLKAFDTWINMIETTWSPTLKSKFDNTLLLELIHESKCQFLYNLSTRAGSFKPVILRNAIEKALEAFPGNSSLLSIFFASEAKTKLENRIRRFLDNLVLMCVFLFTFYFDVLI